jgi:hypothetical protein
MQKFMSGIGKSILMQIACLRYDCINVTEQIIAISNKERKNLVNINVTPIHQKLMIEQANRKRKLFFWV